MFDAMAGVMYAVSDMDASVDFYSKKMGFERPIGGSDENFAGFHIGEKDLWLVSQKAPGEWNLKPGGDAGLFLMVRDIEGTLEELAARGVAIEGPIIDAPSSAKFAHVRDPDGNLIGLFESPDHRELIKFASEA